MASIEPPSSRPGDSSPWPSGQSTHHRGTLGATGEQRGTLAGIEIPPEAPLDRQAARDHLKKVPYALRPSDEDQFHHVTHAAYVRFFEDALSLTAPPVARAALVPCVTCIEYRSETSSKTPCDVEIVPETGDGVSVSGDGPWYSAQLVQQGKVMCRARFLVHAYTPHPLAVRMAGRAEKVHTQNSKL